MVARSAWSAWPARSGRVERAVVLGRLLRGGLALLMCGVLVGLERAGRGGRRGEDRAEGRAAQRGCGDDAAHEHGGTDCGCEDDYACSVHADEDAGRSSERAWSGLRICEGPRVHLPPHALRVGPATCLPTQWGGGLGREAAQTGGGRYLENSVVSVHQLTGFRCLPPL